MGNRFSNIISLFAAVVLVLVLRGTAGFCLVKQDNVAGQFYPSDKQELLHMISSFVGAARLPDNLDIDSVRVLIAPHAGYIFSGPVAGYTYSLLSRLDRVKTVIILAPSHYFYFNGIAFLDVSEYKTPLGTVEIDQEFTNKLVDRLDIAFADNKVFEREHSVEVQLPFIKYVKPDCRVVAGLFGKISFEDMKVAAQQLFSIVKDRDDVILLVSTDMSHYYSYDKAVKMDGKAISVLKKLDANAFYLGILNKDFEFCGWEPLLFSLMFVSHYKESEFRLLKYANSGDTRGDKSRVVGYCAALITAKGQGKAKPMEEVGMLNREQRRKLLSLARRSIEHYLRTGKRLDNLDIDDPLLYKEKGAFVTLEKNGMLRGCIGHIIADMPLCEVVAEMAIQAAVGDPRFPAVTIDEMKDIEIEISVLSPLKKLEDINDIRIGKHGLLLRKGIHSGLLLPQVPVEYGWDRQTFLRHLALKAGLPADGWKDGEIYWFTAEVFSEREVFSEDDESN